MMTKKVMIIDDEAGIRLLLHKITERSPGFEVVAESDNFADAVREFSRFRPQVVFLDVEIKGESGLLCARIFSEMEPQTRIIFATAHTEYMSQAFEVYAFDYLLKPFNVERVEQTLNRIRNMNDGTQTQPEVILRAPKQDKLMVKGRECTSFVDIDEILLVQRVERMTQIITENDCFTTSAGLGDIEEKLDRHKFMRCHKSYIINVSKIRKIEPYGRWTYVVKLKGTDSDALITLENYEKIKRLYT